MVSEEAHGHHDKGDAAQRSDEAPIVDHIIDVEPRADEGQRNNEAHNSTNTGHLNGETKKPVHDDPGTRRPAWEPDVPFTSHIKPPESTIPVMYDKLLAPLLERDKKQCLAWNDEVQNLLIFAGLFSAVVTAFIIETYKGLQPDPNDQLVGLLSHIANRLDNPLNSTTVTAPFNLPPFSPTASIIRVNILWFISLILSLTTVLFGIVSLQWLREHQRYDESTDSRTKFAIFNMRADALQRWYVPQIFAVLPIVLQGAVVLFFAGTVDFLLALRREVAIPVTAFISLAILFLIATTILPTLQAFVLEFPFVLQVNNAIPAPCPYKSPQSLLAARLAALSSFIFRICAHCFAVLFLLFVAAPQHIYRLAPNIRKQQPQSTWPLFLSNLTDAWKCRKFGLKYLFTARSIINHENWSSSEADWLSTRTRYFSWLYSFYERHNATVTRQSSPEIDYVQPSPTSTPFNPLNWLSRFDIAGRLPATYDCMRGLGGIIQLENSYEQRICVYHCNAALGRENIGWMKVFLESKGLTQEFQAVQSIHSSCRTLITLMQPLPLDSDIITAFDTARKLIPGTIQSGGHSGTHVDLAHAHDTHMYVVLSHIIVSGFHQGLAIPEELKKERREYWIRLISPLSDIQVESKHKIEVSTLDYFQFILLSLLHDPLPGLRHLREPDSSRGLPFSAFLTLFTFISDIYDIIEPSQLETLIQIFIHTQKTIEHHDMIRHMSWKLDTSNVLELGPHLKIARMYAQNLMRTTDDDETKRLLSSELFKLLDNVDDGCDKEDKEVKMSQED